MSLRTYLAISILISGFTLCSGQTMEVLSNFHTATVTIKLRDWDTDQNGTIKLQYKKTSASTWLDSYQANYVTDGTEPLARVSLFGLDPNETYVLKGRLEDSSSSDNRLLSEISFTTRKEPIFEASGSILYVSPNGSGTEFSITNPGALSSALKSGLKCGESIHLLDGTYSTGDLTLNLYDSCPEAQPIVIQSENSGRAIIDGGYYQKLNWTKSASDTLMYTASLPSACSYSNLMVLNGVRQYPYATIGNNLFLGNYNLTNLKFGRDGFCRDATTVAFKSATGINPNEADVVLSQHFRGLSISGTGHSIALRIKGIVFQHYGKSKALWCCLQCAMPQH